MAYKSAIQTVDTHFLEMKGVEMHIFFPTARGNIWTKFGKYIGTTKGQAAETLY